jgi:TP901 family phage tail tape measure protein
MAEVSTLTEASTEDLKALGNEIIDLSTRIPQTATELAAAEYDIISAGVALADSTRVLEQSAKAAVAGVTDTKTAANVGIGVINAYGLEIDELGNVYDVLFNTVKNGVTTFPELAQSIGDTLPTAKAAGVSYQEVSAAIASLTKAGIRTPQATTALKGALNALAAPTAEAKKQFDALGITWNGLIPTLEQIAEKNLSIDQMRLLIPDVEARTGVLSLTQNMEGLRQSLAGMEEAGGSMEVAYDKMADTPEAQLKKLKNSINALSIQIGAFASDFIVPAAQEMTRMIGVIRDDDGLAQNLRLLGQSFSGVSEDGEGFLTLLKGVVEGFKYVVYGAQTTMVTLRVLAEVAAATFAAIAFAVEGDFKSAMRVLQDTTPGDNFRAGLDRLEESAKNLGSTFKTLGKDAKEGAKSVEEVSRELTKTPESAEKTRVAVERTSSSIKDLKSELDAATAALKKLTEADEGYQAALDRKLEAQQAYVAAVAEAKREETRIAVQEIYAEERALKDSLDRRLFEIQKMEDLGVVSQLDANRRRLQAQRDYLAEVVEMRQRELDLARETYGAESEEFIQARRAMEAAELDLEKAAWAVTNALRESDKAAADLGRSAQETGKQITRGMTSGKKSITDAKEEMNELKEVTRTAGKEFSNWFYSRLDAVKTAVQEMKTLEELNAYHREYLGAISSPGASVFDYGVRDYARKQYQERLRELEAQNTRNLSAPEPRTTPQSASQTGGSRTLTLNFRAPDGQQVQGAFAEADAGRMLELLRQAGMVVS